MPHALKEPTHIRAKNIWTHETKMNLYQNDGKRKVVSHDLKYITLFVKHGGGSVMAWACIAASGTGLLQFID